MISEKFVMSVHITHKWVDIKDLEIFSSKEARSLLEHINRSPFVEEVLFLKTCNRLEIYLAATDPEKVAMGLRRMIANVRHGSTADFFKIFGGEATVRHLFKVASGIDSMVVGENQILGQLQDALTFAKGSGTVGETLGPLFEKAIKVGQKARISTSIGKGAVSMGSVAVDKAEKELGTLKDKVILVLGAGEMGSLVAKSLSSRNVKAIMVANRTYDAAKELACRLGGEAVQYDELATIGKKADVMICATSAPHIILTKEEITKMRQGIEGKLLIIDISYPINIDPRVQEIEKVKLIDMDGLRTVANENQERRKKEIARVEELIEEEIKVFISKYKEKDAILLVKRLHEFGKDIRDKEIEKALFKLSECQCDQAMHMKEVLMDLSNSIIAKILAIPTISLKAASRNGDIAILETTAKLFNIKGVSEKSVRTPFEGHIQHFLGEPYETSTKTEDEG